MSRRASLPGADELFRRTSGETSRPKEEKQQEAKSTKLQVATPDAAPPPAAAPTPPRRGPKHDEKVTFYCTSDELMDLERARLKLRADHGVAADRGRIVRAALAYVLEDFDARSDDSILLRKLSD